MSVRAIAAWSVAALLAALVTTNPVYRLLVVLIAANVLIAYRPPGRNLRPLAAGLLFAGGVSVLLNVALAHTGRDVIAALPGWVPAVGGPLTLESVVFGLVAALGIAGAVLAVAPLSILVDPVDVVAVLPRPLSATGTAAGAALNLAPAFGRSYTAVRDAQVMRGWRPRGPRSWADLLVPVMLTAIEDSVQLAEAMEARAYGAGRRTRVPGPREPARDRVVAIVAIAAAAALVAARATGVAADWYPYPGLTVPPVSPLVLGACLALAVPLLPWRSQASTA